MNNPAAGHALHPSPPGLPRPNNRDYPETNLPYDSGTMPENIYGVSDEALKAIVKDIKLHLLKKMTEYPGTNLPRTRDEFLALIFRNLNDVYTQMTNLDAINRNLQSSDPNQFINTGTSTPIRRRITDINAPIVIPEILRSEDITMRNLHLMEEADNIDYEEIHLDPRNGAHVVTIQNRLNTIPIMESLYLRKHNELKQMFDFSTLLYNKFNYTLRLLLHVVSLLSEHKSTRDVTPNPIKIPKNVITNIRALIDDQPTMQTAITDARTAVDRVDVEEIGRRFTEIPPVTPATTPPATTPPVETPGTGTPGPPGPPG